jgi:hypothetical protein
MCAGANERANAPIQACQNALPAAHSIRTTSIMAKTGKVHINPVTGERAVARVSPKGYLF